MAKFKTEGVGKEAPSTLVGSSVKAHGESNDVNSILDVWLKIQELQANLSQSISKEMTYLSWVLKDK